MSVPPSVKQMLPSLRIDDAAGTVTMSVADFRRFAAFALADVEVDEEWYMAQYPDVKRDKETRSIPDYANHHFRHFGYIEGRLPHDPDVDEEWYRTTYPDVATSIASGELPNAKMHFIRAGWFEGRRPNPDAPSLTGAAAATPRRPEGERQATAADRSPPWVRGGARPRPR